MTTQASPEEPQETDERILAGRLGVSVEAIQLAHGQELIDLHLDTFIPHRVWGYDFFKRHRGGPLGRHLAGHVDIPRARDGGLTGAMWSITTNVTRPSKNRWSAFLRNLDRLRSIINRSEGKLELARTLTEYRAARAKGAIASMIAIQGGNALEAAPNGVASIPDDVVVRVTLVHLTNSVYGSTSVPISKLRSRRGLTDRGRELVRQLNAARCFVDLAHIHPDGFWDAVEEHDPSQPLIVTHTGVNGVLPHWRNLDDSQIRAIADSGGTIGIIFEPHFLRTRGGPKDGRMVLDHMQYIIDLVGEDFVSIGSDYDGMISPPPELASASSYPRLVQHMLNRGWSAERVSKVLGGNFLRAFGRLRP